MARPTGDVNPFNLNFEIGKQAPIDARTVVALKSELTSTPFAYLGMMISVTSDGANNGVYLLTTGDGTTLSDWDKFSSGTVTDIGEGDYIIVTDSGTDRPNVSADATQAWTDIATDANKLVARDSSGFAYAASPTTGDNSNKLATTSFVQSTLTSSITLVGGFNANTGALEAPLTTNLYTDTSVTEGDYYVVTVAGNFFNNPSIPLTPGDSVIVQTTQTTPGVDENDFIVVRVSTDLATSDVVGLGNVKAGNGISAPYSTGTATISNTDVKFKTITIDSTPSNDIVSNSRIDTLNFRAGSGISLDSDPTTKTLRISTSGSSGMSEWNVQGDTGSAVQVLDANVLNILGETDIETESVIELGIKKLKITHSDVENRITEDDFTLTSGSEFDAIDSLTVSSQGHVIDVNTKTYTLPSTIGGSGTNNTIAMFNTAQGDSLGNSIISQNAGATSVTIGGILNVSNVSTFTGGISANGGITVGSGDSIDTPLITIDNLLSLNGRLELNGDQGTSGQLLASQGASDPIWVDAYSYSWNVQGPNGGSSVSNGSDVEFVGSDGVSVVFSEPLGGSPTLTFSGSALAAPTYFSVGQVGLGADKINEGNISSNTQGFGEITVSGSQSTRSYSISFANNQSDTNYMVLFTVEDPFIQVPNKYPVVAYVQNKAVGGFDLLLKTSDGTLVQNQLARVNFQLYSVPPSP